MLNLKSILSKKQFKSWIYILGIKCTYINNCVLIIMATAAKPVTPHWMEVQQ